ncbi:hypothetical protein Patl1_21009 [Pistacia atlantica]|uniref:Uncharacterized protein n=1 Tax=Pistacia atlantica TaxID=434234 RepID=A0ACC1BIS7_9ROSI|nr:hypothetical protein Patl1_21009 [Pistacia atlantica]
MPRKPIVEVFNVVVVFHRSDANLSKLTTPTSCYRKETLGKLSYIHGKKQPPKELDKGYEKWYAKNQKVKWWLLMSMSPEIMKHCLCLSPAHEIWSALSKAFCDGSDKLLVFSLHQRAFTTKQKGRPHSLCIIES